MEKIVTLPDGSRLAFTSVEVPNAWQVYEKSANGHKEVFFKKLVQWAESDDPVPADTRLDSYDWDAFALKHPDSKLLAAHLAELEEKRQKHALKSAQRAKSQCRWVIKSQGLNEMLTLTYKVNQLDRELCKKHFKEWVRRMKVALGGEFVYCAAFERQERGAMHVHVACRKLPQHGIIRATKIKAFQLGTRIWRDIVKELGGMCFVGGNTKHGGKRRNLSLAKLAAYVSKYIMKDYADAPSESNRYSRSNGLVLPKSQRTVFHGLTMGEMIELVFQCSDGDVIVSHSVTNSDYDNKYWLCTEPGQASHVTVSL
jgi:hypothetical protein